MDLFPTGYSAGDFLTASATGAGSTLTNIGPLIAGIAGVALAVAFAPRLISWIKKAVAK